MKDAGKNNMDMVEMVANLGFPIVMSLLLLAVVDEKLERILETLGEVKLLLEKERKEEN